MPVLPDWVSYHFPPKIHIEVDCAPKAGSYIKTIGTRILIITTQKDLQTNVDLLSIKKGIERNTEGVIIYDDIESVATFKDLDTAAHFARQAQVNCVLAFGSYESVNAAKIISVLTTNDLFAEELIIEGKQIKKKPAPLIVIPTMPLMGMECSPFCFIQDQDGTRKYFSNISLCPELFIADHV